MQEITLNEILSARDLRASTQKEMIEAFSCPLICFTMNIAGPIKNSPEIERAFFEGLDILREKLSVFPVCDERINTLPTGCEAFISVKASAFSLKEICVSIEESSPLGRLFDMDVTDENHQKLSRENERCCIVCAKPGRFCAASRAHTIEELQNVTKKIISDYFLEKDAEKISDFALKCLIDEVNTTPKPGLVDKNNNGSHSDMTLELFVKSANALKPYFKDFVVLGAKNSHITHEEAFAHLKSLGIEAEKAMFSATSGINTHKGIIYSLGLICASIGRLYSAKKPIADTNAILEECAHLCQKSANDDFSAKINTGFGSRLYASCGIKGIRGEALSGFSSVKNISLPIFCDALLKGASKNDAGVLALLHLIANIPDTNLYHRGGENGFRYAKECAKNLIESKKLNLDDVKKLDLCFIEKNLSPGGSADLLAVTYFLYSIINEY